MKHALKYGGVGGLIMVASWWLSRWVVGGENMQLSEVLGFFAMFLALIAVFVGVKNKRDQVDQTVFTFGSGFKIGFNIVLVASAIYVIGWMIYYPNFMPDFMDKYMASQLEAFQAEGFSEEEMQQKKEELETWAKMYENPFIMAGLTFLEFFPIGLIGTLVSAAILRKK